MFKSLSPVLDGGPKTAEAEIMIAEPRARGQKLGQEAMSLMLLYGISTLNIQQFEVKIKEDNVPSINLFKKIGFEQVSEKANVFGEIALKSPCETRDFERKLVTAVGNHSLGKYKRL